VIRLRHANEWVGLVVLLAILVALGVALQAGVLRDWFRPVQTLRILLPESGVAGLAVGADVEVLGTRAGTVRRIVIDPSQQMYAEADIEKQATAFIRRDSKAVIRRRFAVAGAAYVDVTRGTGPELDWDYAVIQAETERAPTDTLSVLLDEVQAKVFPVLDNAGRAMKALATTMERIERGEGNVGRLLSDDSLVRGIEGTVGEAQAAVGDVRGILTELNGVARDAAGLTRSATGKEGGVPALLKRANETLASLQKVVDDLSRASQRLPAIASNVESGTSTLPTLLTQAEQTTYQLEQLIAQLRGLWLLGGGGEETAPDSPARLPATEVRP
jgi:phospholipid/cholesterol/gamma-HCH transport system substrate-binding protein